MDENLTRNIGSIYGLAEGDRHNDHTQICVRKDDGGFVLTDGDTIQDLRAPYFVTARRQLG